MDTDPRQAAQTRRRHEMDRLALLTLEHRSLCCCTRCGQLERAEELSVLIRVSQERVDELTEACCQRLETTCSVIDST